MILKVAVPRFRGPLPHTNLRKRPARKVLGQHSDLRRGPAFSSAITRPAPRRPGHRQRHLFSEKLQEWEDYYNYHRPHGALGGQTLTSAFVRKPKAGVIGLRQLHSRMNERIAPSNDGLTAARP
jgi:hypothetical protein